MIRINQGNSIEITKSALNKHFGQKEIELPLEEAPFDKDCLLVRINPENNALVLGYLVTDRDASWDGWPMPSTINDEIGPEGLMVEFRSEMDRDEAIEALKEKGHIPFIVDRYKHGLVHYSISNTGGYPDRQFDVAPSGVYVLDEITEQMLKDGDINEDQAKEIANRTLDDYSSFCNGDVYICVLEEFKLDEQGNWERTSHDEVMGQMGIDNGMSVLKNELLQHTISPAELAQPVNSFEPN